MLKETLTYKDFDNKEVTETFWFNITKSEIMTDYVLQDEIEQCEKMSRGDLRELTPIEKQFLVDTVKNIIKLAYGKRVGQQHLKTEEAYNEFRYSAAYDEFLFSLFTNEPRAMTFISQVLPQDFKEEIAKIKARETDGSDATSDPTVIEAAAPTQDGIPNWIIEGRQPTSEEWSAATPAQIQEAFKNRNQ